MFKMQCPFSPHPSPIGDTLSTLRGSVADRIKKSVLHCYRLSAEDRRLASIFPRSAVVAKAALTDYGYVRKFAFLRKLQANISDCKILCLYMFAVSHHRAVRFATLKGKPPPPRSISRLRMQSPHSKTSLITFFQNFSKNVINPVFLLVYG